MIVNELHLEGKDHVVLGSGCMGARGSDNRLHKLACNHDILESPLGDIRRGVDSSERKIQGSGRAYDNKPYPSYVALQH